VNTPRTDSHSDKMDNEDFDVELALTYDLARQLENELIAMTALADRLVEALGAIKESAKYVANEDNYLHTEFDPCNHGIQIRDKAKEALAAYEKHKKPEQQIKKPCDCIEKCGKFWIQRCDCLNSTSLAEAQSWCDYENHKKGNTP